MNYDLTPYIGQYIIIRFSAEVQRQNAQGRMVWQLNDANEYPVIGEIIPDTAPDAWYKMSGEWAGHIHNQAPCLYLYTWGVDADTATYEVKNFTITVTPINLDNFTLLDKQGYTAYLERKKTSPKLIQERTNFLERLNAICITDGIATTDAIGDAQLIELVRPWKTDGMRSVLPKIAKFLNDYVTYIKKDNPAQLPLANFIEAYHTKSFEAQAKAAIATRRAQMLPLPTDFAVDPKHLHGLENAAFVGAFHELHAFVLRCYDDIARTPFKWGYPDYDTTEGYYNRVMDMLFAIGLNGTPKNGGITVDGATFFANNSIKRHKKIEQMVANFEQMGLHFKGFAKKAQHFRVTYPNNPHVLAVLHAYTRLLDTTQNDWTWYHFNSLSHRFIEDPATQKYPAFWNHMMDYASDKLREIQVYLFKEATKYGFSVTHSTNKQCINYAKGSKTFLLVREGRRPPGANHFEDDATQIGTKVSFIHAFDRAPEKMRALCHHFPQVFRLDDPGRCCNDKSPGDNPHQFADHSEKSGKRCAFVMKFNLDGVAYKRCGLANFFFEDITLEDVKAILEMFIIENKIKQVMPNA